MPLSTCNLDTLCTGKLLTLSGPNTIKTNVVLERIRACHVVVAGIACAHNHTAGLVSLSRHRLAACGDFDIGGSDGLGHRHQQPEFNGVGRELRKRLAAGCRGICDHFPAARLALASKPKLEVPRWLPRHVASKCHSLGRRSFAAREP